MQIAFVKMEGAGNDYVHVDGIAAPFASERGAEFARAWSDRHFGIGSDGLIVMVRGAAAPVRMLMWNADGSRGAMCGNGLRCLARHAYEAGHVRSERFVVETDAGPRAVQLRLAGGAVASVVTELGEVTAAADPVTVHAAGRSLQLHLGSAGNPHAVAFLDGSPDDFPVCEVGAALQTHALFPDGVNVEFVQVERPSVLRQRTFERGSGETLACGTGAAVAATAARRTGRIAGGPVQVRLRGGELTVDWRGPVLVIEGPARTVFRGVVNVPQQQ